MSEQIHENQAINPKSRFDLNSHRHFLEGLVRIAYGRSEPGMFLEGESHLIQRYELYGGNGQVIRAENLNLPQLDLSGLSHGLYLLRVYGRDGALSFVGKVVKE